LFQVEFAVDDLPNILKGLFCPIVVRRNYSEMLLSDFAEILCLRRAKSAGIENEIICDNVPSTNIEVANPEFILVAKRLNPYHENLRELSMIVLCAIARGWSLSARFKK